MRGLTSTQLSIIELADRGMPVERIASQINVPLATVRSELELISRMVKRGDFAPALLPIEAAAASAADMQERAHNKR